MTREAIFLSLLTRPPLAKSAPRATWASFMRSTSSSRVGTNRSATEIMMAMSWEGILRNRRGRRSLSIPLTRAEEEVVMVKMAPAETRAVNCHTTRPPR
jgi:hypothetical protein